MKERKEEVEKERKEEVEKGRKEEVEKDREGEKRRCREENSIKQKGRKGNGKGETERERKEWKKVVDRETQKGERKRQK